MLPAGSRLTRRAEFTSVVRNGRRAGVRRLVAHLAVQEPGHRRAGLVVSRAVGGSVVRHRVARRLRHLLAERLPALPDGARLVVRALPASAAATSAELGADLDTALRSAVRKLGLSPSAGPR